MQISAGRRPIRQAGRVDLTCCVRRAQQPPALHHPPCRPAPRLCVFALARPCRPSTPPSPGERVCASRAVCAVRSPRRVMFVPQGQPNGVPRCTRLRQPCARQAAKGGLTLSYCTSCQRRAPCPPVSLVLLATRAEPYALSPAMWPACRRIIRTRTPDGSQPPDRGLTGLEFHANWSLLDLPRRCSG